jgi:arsenate reductase
MSACSSTIGPQEVWSGEKPTPLEQAMLTFYHYAKCATCVKAKKYLMAKGYNLKEVDITTDPPNPAILTGLIQKSGRPYTDFLNRSGQVYREQDMKEKVASLSEKEIVAILARNGRLIKRPIVTDGKQTTVGFSEAEFSKHWP